ncbi:MAG: response regulator receiver protein [Bacteroidetes bacterium]|nr:response regulator receiver protein [Bacteroidota bacterium]
MANNFLKKLFSSKTANTGIVFIVEDNAAYAKLLDFYIKNNFKNVKEVKIFPVGETALDELHRNPDLIIMDYFLNSRYHDAETGLETIKTIRAQKPEMNIIVLSAQSDVDVMLEAIEKYHCSYLRKNDQAFEKIGELMKEIGGFTA